MVIRCLILACALSSPCLGYPPVPKPALPTVESWGTLVDPDRNCRATMEKGTLTLTVPAGYHDITHIQGSGTSNAPRILRPASGDFVMETRLGKFAAPESGDGTPFRFFFQASGLVVWKDENNFVRIERAHIKLGAKPYVRVEVFREGVSVDKSEKWNLEAGELNLRAERKGKAMTYSWRYDTVKDWTAFALKPAEMEGPLEVGIHACHNAAIEFKPTFEKLSLDAKK